ncbi:hypothetical protein IFM89_030083 [Coptis chinensis]|uniref:RNase H type-1 domain-containing protein n=1 Tax=Coptis chinensis TaxID=261450 RepID=A0A835M7L0_9MAGN|nr:hypothetical protein IFM89_030083 [Coptis chinensis]
MGWELPSQVIDEVGKMELFNLSFFLAVLKVLEFNIPLLASIQIPKFGHDIPGELIGAEHDHSVVGVYLPLFPFLNTNLDQRMAFAYDVCFGEITCSSHESLVVCFGEILIDFVPTISGISLAESLTFKKGLGGPMGSVNSCFHNTGAEAIYQEIQAIAAGLKQAQEMGIENLEVNSDSLGAINILKGSERSPWYCANTVACIRSITRSFVKCSFSHIFREENQAVDYLSKLYRSPDDGDVVFSPPLDEKLHRIIEEDRKGTLYPRFSSNTG